jgi:methionine sulfoxide reductase heme-binding subunit
VAVRSWLRVNWLRVLAHAAGLLPAAWLALDYLRGADSFTFNRTVMLRSGSAALALLLASFACTPLSRLLRWPALKRVRRAFGLYGFGYTLLHVWNYAVWENGLEPALILRDLGERRAMTIGLLALLALIPLALTSTRGWQQRLGKRWKTLHRLVYVAVPLSVWHYYWLERDIVTVPLLAAGLVAILLVLRLPVARDFLIKKNKGPNNKPARS